MTIIKNDEKMMMILTGEVCETCGDKVLVANTTDAASEKHVPVCEFKDGTLSVCVGDVKHPMSKEHHIAWILVELRDGHIFKELNPNTDPTAIFNVNKEDVVAVYEYCNLHGLWKVVI